MTGLSDTAPVRLPVTPVQAQRLAGWVRMLDVDLELAQRVLRGPVHALPAPPLALPAVVSPGWPGCPDTVLAAAVPAPSDGPDGGPDEPVPVRVLRGAYARRAGRG